MNAVKFCVWVGAFATAFVLSVVLYSRYWTIRTTSIDLETGRTMYEMKIGGRVQETMIQAFMYEDSSENVAPRWVILNMKTPLITRHYNRRSGSASATLNQLESALSLSEKTFSERRSIFSRVQRLFRSGDYAGVDKCVTDLSHELQIEKTEQKTD